MEDIRQQDRRLLEDDILRQKESDAARCIQGAWNGWKLRVRLSQLKVCRRWLSCETGSLQVFIPPKILGLASRTSVAPQWRSGTIAHRQYNMKQTG